MFKYFTLCYWKYLFENCDSINQFFCRMNGHKCGPIWYNFSLEAIEPDMHCKNCGEDLG